MTIVTSLAHQPTFRERQEFEVMMVLEKSIRSDLTIDTNVLAKRVVRALDDLEPEAYQDEKPRIRVPAGSERVSRGADLGSQLRQFAESLGVDLPG